MFILLTTRPGIYRASLINSTAIKYSETYEYRFAGDVKNIFTLAEIIDHQHVRIVEDSPPHTVNTIRATLLPHFATLEEGRAELQKLASLGGSAYELVRRS